MTDMIGPQRGRKAIRFGTKVPVRYVLRSGLRKTAEVKRGIVTDISTRGIRFETEEQLREGAIIKVEIILPENIVVEATGKVGRATPLEKEKTGYYEIALGFTEITETAKEEINMWYYSERVSPEAGIQENERKSSEHLKAGTGFIEYREKRLLRKQLWQETGIKHISKHGLTVTATTDAKEGDVWEMMMHLPDYTKPIEAVATVVTVKTQGAVSDVVLEFTIIEESDRKRVSELTFVKEGDDKPFGELR